MDNAFEMQLAAQIKSIIARWDEQGIYAISFFVYTPFGAASEFAISYNTEGDIARAKTHYASAAEIRWNYAFWRQNTTYILNPYEGDKSHEDLMMTISNVANQLQTEGFVCEKFGAIPIIVHELEYHDLVRDATKNANPNGEANDFLVALGNMFA
ncbi:MAG: DUF4303 domain-containing protein [Defluviitaleaceae bacterium]|nr:DUF4303 domain-containing protein [Defluviitaleaceae bacterium]